MDTFELFNNGKLILPGKEAGFVEIEWSKHPTFEGVELKHIIMAKDTDGKFSYHLVRIAPDCSIGNHIHETQLETHEVIRGSGKCVNAGSTISYEPGIISIMQAGVPHEVTAGSEGLYYVCLPSLCLHYVKLNKRIMSKDRRRWLTTICGGLLFP